MYYVCKTRVWILSADAPMRMWHVICMINWLSNYTILQFFKRQRQAVATTKYLPLSLSVSHSPTYYHPPCNHFLLMHLFSTKALEAKKASTTRLFNIEEATLLVCKSVLFLPVAALLRLPSWLVTVSAAAALDSSVWEGVFTQSTPFPAMRLS